ncbi:MAG TPA: FAD-dependent oxidoreductase [Gaiellaceae bacterium]|nr:FAD-dependent oxidoreductase [Gaiellaceae bacterium]
MVTPDEIGQVEIFAPLEQAAREQLARAAADITLMPGEWAAPDGSERALFAVVDGRIEAVKLTDGIERVVGHRLPGDIFGEVPITLGTVFPVGFRAAEESRVLRLEPHDYYTAVALHPDIGREVGRLAAHRMGGSRGLQGLAAEPSPPRAVLLGHRLDPVCTELRTFLDRNQIVFTWLQPDAADAAEQWGAPLPPEEELPVVRVLDGETVSRPRLRRVAELLGLGTEPQAAEYDTIVIGAGPAGLAAGVYGASEGLRTIVIEREAPGGQAGSSSRIENYLGFPTGLSGQELASRAFQQAQRLGAEILVTRTIDRLDVAAREVHLDGGDVLHGRTIILALGVSWRRLSIDGCDRLLGKGVSYGAARGEARATHGRHVHIIGAGNSAGQAAIHFSAYAQSVSVLCRGDRLGTSMSSYLIDQLGRRRNIRVRLRSQVVATHGDEALEAVDVHDAAAGETTREESGGLFIMIGADAETGWLPPEIAVDENGYVLTGSDVRLAGRWELDRDPYLLETSVPGIFACGDVRLGPVKRVAAAVGEGSMAIAFVHQYLAGAEDAAAAPRG